MLGYDADELKTVKIWDLVVEDDQEELKSLFADFEAKQIDVNPYPWEFTQKDGDTVRLEGNIN